MRYPITFLSGLLIFILGGLWIAPSLYDFSSMVSRLLLAQSNERAFHIASYEGIDVRFLPRPTVRLQRAKVVPAGGETLDVDQLTLEYGMGVLFGQNQTPDRVIVSGARVRLKGKDSLRILRDDMGGLPRLNISVQQLSLTVLVSSDSPPVIFENVKADLKTEGALQPINVEFSFDRDKHHFKGSIESSAPALVQMPLEFRLSSPETLNFAFSGHVTRNYVPEMSGEFSLTTDRMLPAILERLGFSVTMPVASRLSSRGLLFVNEEGVQTDNIRLNVLGQEVGLRASIEFTPDGQIGTAYMRVNAENFDLGHVKYIGRIDRTHQPALVELFGAFVRSPPPVEVAITVDRLRYSGEDVVDAKLSFGLSDRGINIYRLGGTLPFNTNVLLAGNLDLDEGAPLFNGNLALNSADVKSAIMWLNEDIKFLSPELLDFVKASKMQRLSLSADIDINAKQVLLNDLLGQIDGREYAVDVLFDRQADNTDISIQTPLFDLAEWGDILADLPVGRARLTELPYAKWLTNTLRAVPEGRQLSVKFQAGDFNIDTERLGQVELGLSLDSDRVRIDQLDVAQFEGSHLSGSGVMRVIDDLPSGQLQLMIDSPPTSEFAHAMEDLFAPLPVSLDTPLKINSRWVWSGPEAVTPVMMSALVSVGDLQGVAELKSPRRDVRLISKDTKFRLTLTGSQRDLVTFIGMNDGNDAAFTHRLGQIKLGVEGITYETANISSDISLGLDRLRFAGTVSALGNERRIDGAGELSIVDVGSYSLLSGHPQRTPLVARAQFSLQPNRTSFSNLALRLGQGLVSGEGVINAVNNRPQVTTSLSLSNFDFSPFVPRHEQGQWSGAEISWPALGLADAVLELRGSGSRVGHLWVDQFQGRFKIIDGVLEAPSINVKAMGGQLSAALNAEGGSLLPSFQLSGSIKQLDVSKLSMSLFGREVGKAEVNGQFALKGRGRSAEGFMRGLTGTVQLESGKGEVIGLDFDRLLLFSGEIQEGQALRLSDVTGSTSFGRAEFLGSLQDGVLLIEKGDLTTATNEGLSLFGSLDIFGQKYQTDVAFISNNVAPVIEIRGALDQPVLSLVSGR